MPKKLLKTSKKPPKIHKKHPPLLHMSEKSPIFAPKILE
jgi:hypothetical protein